MADALPKLSIEEAYSTLSVAVVDDDPAVASTLSRVLRELGVNNVSEHTDVNQFIEDRLKHPLDVVFTDLVMPEKDGFALIDFLQHSNHNVLTIVVSAYSSLENAVQAVKAGAFEFVSKPFDIDVIDSTLRKIVNHKTIQHRLGKTDSRETSDPYLIDILGTSESISDIRRTVSIARDVDANVLIEGETGTGKELIARALHAGKGPFVAVNAATIVDELAESELFGHAQGAFTGATSNKKGLIEAANGGILFLDEINSMGRTMQVKLLRMLQERVVRPVGSTRDIAVNFRLICATNEELEEAVLAGQFRMDLYHRINVIPIRLPPLRERPDDISELAKKFVERFSRFHQKTTANLSQSAMDILEHHQWPGNVRELQNVIERAIIFAGPKQIISAEHLERVFQTTRPITTSSNGFEAPLGISMREMEARYAQVILEQVGGNKSEAARILGIDYKTLVNRLNFSFSD